VADRAHWHVEQSRRGPLDHLRGGGRPDHRVRTLAALLEVSDVVLGKHPQRRGRLLDLDRLVPLSLERLEEPGLRVLRLILRSSIHTSTPALVADARLPNPRPVTLVSSDGHQHLLPCSIDLRA